MATEINFTGRDGHLQTCYTGFAHLDGKLYGASHNGEHILELDPATGHLVDVPTGSSAFLVNRPLACRQKVYFASGDLLGSGNAGLLEYDPRTQESRTINLGRATAFQGDGVELGGEAHFFASSGDEPGMRIFDAATGVVQTVSFLGCSMDETLQAGDLAEMRCGCMCAAAGKFFLSVHFEKQGLGFPCILEWDPGANSLRKCFFKSCLEQPPIFGAVSSGGRAYFFSREGGKVMELEPATHCLRTLNIEALGDEVADVVPVADQLWFLAANQPCFLVLDEGGLERRSIFAESHGGILGRCCVIDTSVFALCKCRQKLLRLEVAMPVREASSLKRALANMDFEAQDGQLQPVKRQCKDEALQQEAEAAQQEADAAQQAAAELARAAAAAAAAAQAAQAKAQDRQKCLEEAEAEAKALAKAEEEQAKLAQAVAQVREEEEARWTEVLEMAREEERARGAWALSQAMAAEEVRRRQAVSQALEEERKKADQLHEEAAARQEALTSEAVAQALREEREREAVRLANAVAQAKRELRISQAAAQVRQQEEASRAARESKLQEEARLAQAEVLAKAEEYIATSLAAAKEEARARSAQALSQAIEEMQENVAKALAQVKEEERARSIEAVAQAKEEERALAAQELAAARQAEGVLSTKALAKAMEKVEERLAQAVARVREEEAAKSAEALAEAGAAVEDQLCKAREEERAKGTATMERALGEMRGRLEKALLLAKEEARAKSAFEVAMQNEPQRRASWTMFAQWPDLWLRHASQISLPSSDVRWNMVKSLVCGTCASHREKPWSKHFCPAPQLEVQEIRLLFDPRKATNYLALQKKVQHVRGERCTAIPALAHLLLRQEFGERQLNEHLLFYGAPDCLVDELCSEGFDTRRASVAGKMCGDGIYFAANASTADLSTEDSSHRRPWNADRRLILARVLLGESYRATSAMPGAHRPPRGQDGKRFDSVWSDLHSNGGFVDHVEAVVYNPAQAIPVAVVTYRHAADCCCAACVTRPL